MFLFYWIYYCTQTFILCVHSAEGNSEVKVGDLIFGNQKLRYEDVCREVCQDLPANDIHPVCMMFSRYKKGYQFFVNECHARRAVCKENIVLHMVHPSRCMKSYQFFMPVN